MLAPARVGGDVREARKRLPTSLHIVQIGNGALQDSRRSVHYICRIVVPSKIIVFG